MQHTTKLLTEYAVIFVRTGIALLFTSETVRNPPAPSGPTSNPIWNRLERCALCLSQRTILKRANESTLRNTHAVLFFHGCCMSRLLAFVLAAVAFSCAGCTYDMRATGSDAPAPDTTWADPMTLFDFEPPDAARWTVENDGVMGGRSEGFVEVADGTLVFTGEVVTEGGGFTSVRAAQQVDLSEYDGIALRVRGGGRTFEIDVDDGTRSRGREVNRRGPIPTSDSWTTVRIPFDTLQASAHGEPMTVDALDRASVRSIGIYIIDGQDGPFRLEVDWIRAYRT